AQRWERPGGQLLGGAGGIAGPAAVGDDEDAPVGVLFLDRLDLRGQFLALGEGVADVLEVLEEAAQAVAPVELPDLVRQSRLPEADVARDVYQVQSADALD